MSPLVEVEGMVKTFPVRRGLLQRKVGEIRAVDGVTLAVTPGECLALVGESGSGKTTFGRCLLRLIEPTAGRVLFAGEDLSRLPARVLRRRRRRFQMIFQDPYSSLNPRMQVRRILEEPLAIHRLRPRGERAARIVELLALVGLPASAAGRYPHEFSGGQRQRISIARALATEPDLLVADEPVSALDVSVRAQVVNLLSDLQVELGLTLLFIAHDLALVEQVADRVAVMYLGQIVEIGPARSLFAAPRHPYTVSLLSAVPVPEVNSGRSRILLPGELPSPASPPAGCRFHTRCPIARPRCAREVPPLVAAQDGHPTACFYAGELPLAGSSRASGLGTN